MGWSEGKGLGKDEQGIVEIMKSKKLTKQAGLGYKKEDGNLPNHYGAFENVLSNLNSLNTTNSDSYDTKELSIEEPLLHSKRTLRYKKFAKFKDVTQYNEKDLACVLGTKMLDKQNDIGENTHHHENYTYSRTSLKDYFEEKMEQIQKKREEGILGRSQQNLACNISIPDLDFEPAKTEFSFNISTVEPLDQTNPPCDNKDNGVETIRKSKKKKSKKGSRNKEPKDSDANAKEVEKCELSESEAALFSSEKTSNVVDYPAKGRLLGKVKKFIPTVTLGQEQQQNKSEKQSILPKTEKEMLNGDQNLASNCIIPDLEFEPAKTKFSFDKTCLKQKKDEEEETRKIKKKKSKKSSRNKELEGGSAEEREEKCELNESETTLASLENMKSSEVDYPAEKRLLGKVKKLIPTVSLGQEQHQNKSEKHLILSKTENEMLSGNQNLASNCSISDLAIDPAKTEFSFNKSSLKRKKEDEEEMKKIKKKKSKKGSCNKELEGSSAEEREGKCELNESQTTLASLENMKTSNEVNYLAKSRLCGKVKNSISTVIWGQKEEYLIDSKSEKEMLSRSQNLTSDCIIPDLEFEPAKTEFSFDVSTTENKDKTSLTSEKDDDGEETRKIKKKKSKKGIHNKELDGGTEAKEREKSGLNKSYAEAVQLTETKAANGEQEFLHKGENFFRKMKRLFSTERLAQGRQCDKLEGASMDSNVEADVNSVHENLKDAEENSEGKVINHDKIEIENVKEQERDLKKSSSIITVLIKNQEHVIDVNHIFPGSNLASINGYDKVQKFRKPDC